MAAAQHRYPARRHVPAHRPQARQAESHRRGLPRHLRDRLDPHLRPRRPLRRTRPGLLHRPAAPPARPGTRSARSSASTPARKSSSSTTPPSPAPPLRRPGGTGGVTGSRRPARRNTVITCHSLRCHATHRNLGRSPAALAAKLPRVAGCTRTMSFDFGVMATNTLSNCSSRFSHSRSCDLSGRALACPGAWSQTPVNETETETGVALRAHQARRQARMRPAEMRVKAKALCGTGASRPRARARSMASSRRWAPSLSYRCRMCVRIVFTDT